MWRGPEADAADGSGKVVVSDHVIKALSMNDAEAAAALSGEFDAVRSGSPCFSSESDFAEAAAGSWPTPAKDEEDTAVVFMGTVRSMRQRGLRRLLDKLEPWVLTNVLSGTVEGRVN
jgi:hypothetical protein